MKKKKKKQPSHWPSKKTQSEEIIKCGTDVRYFIKNYVRIDHPKKGWVKFKTFPFQDECLDAFMNHRYIIVNKSRQLGLSTSSAAYSLWLALFRRSKNVLVVATKLATAQNFIKKVRTMYKSLPEWLVMPTLVEDNKASLSWDNSSTIKAVPCAPDAGRSEALSLLIVDEAAHIDGIDEMWLGIQPTLSTGGSVIMISSPSGVGTLFHRLWVGARSGKNDFHAIELPWTVHPERDQKWFEKEARALIEAKGQRGVAQELLCDFSAAGDTFLNPESMEYLFDTIEEPIRKVPHGRYYAWIWENPKPGFKYIIAADVARGDADDFSTFHIVNEQDRTVVADFKGKQPPDEFANLLLNYAKLYNQATICQELNNVGVACAQTLKASGYPNLYYEKFQKNIYMSYATQELKPTDYPGFTMSQATREQSLARLENEVRNKSLRLRSKRLYEEFQTFTWKGNKPQAQKGHNDDMVMALAIACNLIQFSAGNVNSEDAQWALLSGMSRINSDFNAMTGQTTEKTHTSDGFFSVNPNTGKKVPSIRNAQNVEQKKPEKSNLEKQMDRSQAKNLTHSRNHNYNDAKWDDYRWLFDD